MLVRLCYFNPNCHPPFGHMPFYMLCFSSIEFPLPFLIINLPTSFFMINYLTLIFSKCLDVFVMLPLYIIIEPNFNQELKRLFYWVTSLVIKVLFFLIFTLEKFSYLDMFLFMKMCFLTLKTHPLLLMISNILQFHLPKFPFLLLINHPLFLFLSLMIFYHLLHLHLPLMMSLFLPENPLELEMLLLTYKIMFVTVHILLHIPYPIIFLIIMCMLIMLPLFFVYKLTMNHIPMLRRASMIVGNKQCKLSYWLLRRLDLGHCGFVTSCQTYWLQMDI